MAEEEKKTYESASKVKGEIPSTQYKAGSNIGGLDIITPYGNTISGSLKDNNAIETTPSDMQSARIGDYYLTSKGIAKLVPNSEADIDRKLRAIYGASPKQDLKPTDYANAALTAGAAFLGLPTDQSNFASTVGTFLAGKAAGLHKITRAAWTVYSLFKSLSDADNRYLDDFSNQMVNVKPAYHIEERDGQRYAVIDEDAATSAGYGSGSLISDITDYDKNKERTNVTLENGMLNISASSPYLNSDRYADMVDWIKSVYPDGITEEEANRVTDEDGKPKTMLERIKDMVVSDEAQFYSKAESIKLFKQLAPSASNLALNEAYDTQTIGYMDTKTLEGTDVTIYDSDNNKKEVNALEYLRTIRDMSDEERNNYMAELGNRVLSDDISDDEKVVLRAQANALYAASSQESGEFKDMYKKDFGDSIADVSFPVIGRIGNWYGADELDTFETNEFYASGLTLASGVVNLLTMKKIMGANEAGIRKGISALGSKTGIGFLKNINEFAPSSGHYVMNLAADNLMKDIKELGMRGLSDFSKFTIDAAADLGYEAVTAAAHNISGQDFNFKEEFWRDLYLDAIMDAGPQNFVKFAEMDKTALKKINGEVQFVKQSADELRARRSKISTDLTASNTAMSTLKSFFDMHYALLRNAVRSAAFTKGDSVEQQKLIRLSADVEQVASSELSKFMVSNKEVAQHFMDYNKALSDVAPKPKNYTKADRNYINAAANQHRFEQMAKGDRSATIAVHKKYKEALNGVSKERAKQLDTFLNSMRTICGDLLDFYKERGLISKETYEAFKNHPSYKDNMFFPVWVKDKKYTAKDIVPQDRKALKEVLDPKDLLDVDTFEDPLVTFSLYMNAVMRNVAANERKLAAIEAGLIAGMETRVTKDTGGHLAEYEILNKYSDQFKGKYDRIVREVKKEVPTLEEYKQDNEAAVQRSGAFKNIEQFKALQDEGRELRNRLRREQRALEKAQKGELEGVDFVDAHKYITEKVSEGYNKFVEENSAAREAASKGIKGNIADIAAEQIVTPGGIVDTINQQMRNGELELGKDGEAAGIEFKDIIDRIDIDLLAINHYGHGKDYIDAANGFGDFSPVADLDLVNLYRELTGKKPFSEDTDVELSSKEAKELRTKIRGLIRDDVLKALRDGNRELTNNVVLYRVLSSEGNDVGSGDMSWISEKSGNYKDDGFGFVTLDENAVLNSDVLKGSGDKYVLRIHAPKGTGIFAFSGENVNPGDGMFGPEAVVSSGHRAGGEMALAPGQKGEFIKTGIKQNGAEYVDVYLDGWKDEAKDSAFENDAIDNAQSSAITIRNNGGKTYTDYGLSAYAGRYFEAENPNTLYENSVKTDEQEEALRYYTAYNQLNSYLRNPESVTPKVGEWLDKKVKALDSAISGKLSQNTVVYRAMGDDLYRTIGDSPVFDNPGYTSATLNPEVVSDSLGDMVRLTVDEGTKALYVGDKTANIGIGKMKNEQEILFPRNMTVVITRDYSKLTPEQRDELGLPDKVKYDGILVPKSKAKKYKGLKIEDFGGSAPKDKIKESLSKSGEKADSLFDFLVPTEEELSGLLDNAADRYNEKSAYEKLFMLPDSFGWRVIDFISSSLGERIMTPTVDDFKRAVAANPEGYARLNAMFAAEIEKRANDTATKELSSKYPAFDVYGAVKSAAGGSSDMLGPLNEVPGSFEGGRHDSLADYFSQGFRGAAVLEMSPDEYLREIGNGRNSEGWEDFISSNKVERYKRMSARGSKSPLMSIIYDSEGGYENQEGRHRALMAEALGYKKIPVVIKYDTRNAPDALTKYTDVTDGFKRAVAESQGYTYDVEGNIIKDTPREEFDVEARAESLLKQDRAQTPVERALADIDQTRQEIVMNKQEQMKVIDDLPRLTKNLMKRQQAKNVWSPVALDVGSYLNIQFVNDVREALKQNNSYANLYTAISRAVTRANPYVSQEDVIDKRAGEAAVKFRKKLSKDLPGQGETKIDTMLNKILEKFNVKPKVYDKDRGVVHYWMDGKIETVTFEGPGASFLADALNAPDFAPPKTTTEMLREKGRGIGRKFARLKRTLTSAVDVVSAARNIQRDILRGTVTTGGQILLSPKDLETEAKEYWKDSPEAIEKIERGWRLAREAMKGSTFAQSLEVPKRNRSKSMIVAAHSATAPNGFIRFIWDFKNKTVAGKASTLNDAVEHLTRYRVSDVTYYRTLAQESAKGATIDEAINAAMEASYFNGKEATTNFARRGTFIGRVAENVPYLSQRFSSIQSLYLEWVNNPIAFTRSLRSFIFAYSALLAITLSNEESRKRYFLLTDYDRANNVIIPLDDGMIITIPLDENLAAFATAWRRGIETLNGVDPEAFYLWGVEALAALSPLDLTGFSEGDKFNVERGFQKLGSEMLPTWSLPILENAQGRDFYYGTKIRIDEEYTERYYDNPNPTPGEMTTKGKNSKTLAALSNLTGIPQWKLQNLLETYGGTVGQYVLNGLDKIQGATIEEQGGKEFKDAIFKPFTGADSNAARDALWEGINRLNDEKAKLKKELKGIDNKIEASTGDEKAKLQEERQKKIDDYGTRVTDFVSQYMSAYEITGGLSKKDANRIWYLYDIHGDADNAGTYLDDSYESYLNNKIRKQKNKHTTNLAAGFGLDQFIDRSKWVSDYNDTYAKQAFENSIYGQGYQTMAKIAKVFEDTSDYNNSLAKLRNDAYEARKKAYAANNYDLADAIAYEYDYKILSAALPYLEDAGLEQSLNNSTVMDYLKDWIMVPSEEMKAANGRYLSRLPSETEKSEAFKKRFIKKMYGVLEDE